MSNKNNLPANQTQSSRSTTRIPANQRREYIHVKNNAALDRLEAWVENELELLVDRNLAFESPSSNKKFFSR